MTGTGMLSRRKSTAGFRPTKRTAKNAAAAGGRAKLNKRTNLITTDITMETNNISSGEIIVHIQHMEYENKRLKEELSVLKASRFDAGRFYAALHNVHPDTVRKYVSLGLIEKHPDSMDAKILMRASEALLLDFTELKRRYRMRSFNK